MDRVSQPSTMASLVTDYIYLWTSLTLLILSSSQASYPGSLSMEVCGWENFEVSCDKNEMLLMENATYGRPRMGHCIKRDFGYLGCGSDVTKQMHQLCSGRRECNFPISVLHGDHGCPNDLTAQLNAVYRCVPVVSCASNMCQKSDYLKVAQPSGFLSSEVTWQTECGTKTCPWVIQAEDGQRINLTLYDFSDGFKRQDPGKICYKYATVDDSSTVTKDITVCTGDGHAPTVSNIFLSEGSRVSVSLYTANSQDQLIYFALKYDIVGCPVIKPPRNAMVKREGNAITIFCNSTKKQWTLKCDGRSWIGEMGSCHGDNYQIGGLIGGSDSQTFGMLVIIGLGVAIGVVIGGLLLAIALIYLKKRKTTTPPTETRLLDENGFYSDQRYIRENMKNSIPLKQENQMPAYPSHDHDYTCTLPLRQSQQMSRDGHFRVETKPGLESMEMEDDTFPPPPDFKVREHIYETPRFPIQEMSIKGIRTQSADGIARKMDSEEGRSNRTN